MLTDLEKNAIREHYQNIADSLPHFCPRTAQRQMLAAVANAFAATQEKSEAEPAPERLGESIVVIEGPTGVGKSLAYLLAGGIMAQMRGKKLIVSSATVALQEQLVERDLPFLVAHSGLNLSFTLAKGRGRYLCPYKLYQLTQANAQDNLAGFETPSVLWEQQPRKEDLALLRDMADQFASRRFNGDRDHWPQKIDDVLWSKVTNDRHGCLKAACPNRPECPFFLARDLLDSVDVVVTNHDLLLADIGMGGGVILPAPGSSFYCIDEAHHLPQKALNQFAAEHSLNQALWFLDKLGAVVAKAAAVADKTALAELIMEAVAALQESFYQWSAQLAEIPELAAQESANEPCWLWTDDVPQDLTILVQNTALPARMLLKHLNDLNEALSGCKRDKTQDGSLLDRLISELGMFVARSEQIADVWILMATETMEGGIPLAKWIVRQTGDKADYRFHASPISSAAKLASGLWRRAAGAVLTSATLRSLGSFDLLLQQTGLHWLTETKTLALDSPFDFAQQGELYIPPLNSSPKDAEAHTAEIVQWLPQLISASEPIGTLVLFSSRRQMQEVALRLPVSHLPLLLIQGELPKQVLLTRHHETVAAGRASIIFGLDSFAEGLDLPGDACVQVIIAKLPFSMPDNPIEKTRSRWIEERGGNPFMEITVPEASIKLIQAVGRLIRTETDYGRVTILDKRIITARYGKQLLACLPPFKRIG
ncbi:ATP-dependent DNA helicase DinG [Neisseriaceae bacterium ESL0693]|nr:ATP-dependent DNA helicase DinG [Neisseriaceae bacterium ESL0693]